MIKMNFKTILICVSLLCEMPIYSQTIQARPQEWAKKINGSKLSNLYKINDSIYRCAQPDSADFAKIDSIGIKSILNLRSNFSDNDLKDGLPLSLYNVEMVPYDIDDKEIVKALRILKNSPKPIVVHCFYGSDRTGVVIAMYRIIFQNWTKEEALNEMMNGGYSFHNIFINIPHYVKVADIVKIKKEISNQN
jgi:protein tyrosine/serine phosphatase